MLLQKPDRTRPGFYRRIPVGAFAFVLSLEERMAGPFVKFMFVIFMSRPHILNDNGGRRSVVICRLPPFLVATNIIEYLLFVATNIVD